MKISPIHKAIADNYIANGGNGTKAYLTVKPTVKTNTAKTKASEVLNRPEVQGYLQEQQDKVSVQAIASKEALIRRAHRIGNKAEEQDKLNTALTACETIGKLNKVYDTDSGGAENYAKVIQGLIIHGDVNIYQDKDKTIDVSPSDDR